MEQDTLSGALAKLPERLTVFDKRIGRYCGHISTGKGITLKTPLGSVFLYHSFSHKLIHHPEAVTEDELERVVSNIR